MAKKNKSKHDDVSLGHGYIVTAKPSKPSFSKASIEKMMGEKPKKKAKKMKKESSERLYIKKLITHTERHIKNDGSDLDQVFVGQKAKLVKQLGETK